ncbi:MAG: hypothetical protein U9Q71_01725, partial [Pseudomonadota bacterium]|nr:hypothetical protein [Pseudomonadota bacterium]
RAMKRRPVSPFSLSFLDILFCGFGAVVLLVLILNHDTVQSRNALFANLRADVMKLESEVIVGSENLVEIRNSLEQTDKKLVRIEGESERVQQVLSELETGRSKMSRETNASREHINQLKSDLKGLDKERAKAEAAARETEEQQGGKVHEFTGEGDRQYLTGLKMGGKRILVLLDASASMLDETLVNVIRRRHMSDDKKRNAPKWNRALAATEWLVSNLPADAQFQLYTFNTGARPAAPDSKGKWLQTAKTEDVAGAVKGVRQTLPAGGTSLYHAFMVADSLTPKPDNILLITDGLPTQGRTKPTGSKVSGDQRLKHFRRAARALPAGIPVNTILLPMEGDAYAAAAFWKLGIDTRGSFLTPARDWP